MKNLYSSIAIGILLGTPLMAVNTHVCPKLVYKDIQGVSENNPILEITSEDGVTRKFRLTGVKALPNWKNPLIRFKFAPGIISEENAGAATIRCKYRYKTVAGNPYYFSILAFPPDDVLISISFFQKTTKDKFMALEAAYKKALVDYPNNKDLIGDRWRMIQDYFGDK